MFEEACRRARVNASQLAHVGDEPDTDLAGALNAGVSVIWMNRRGLPAVPDIAHHAEVRDMAQLLALLGTN
jgi:putative hydrolase of the HAD superfamily